MLITFSGLDGAGKSTLIEWLTQEIKRRQRQVTVLQMNDQVGIYAYLRAIRARLRGATGNGSGNTLPRMRNSNDGWRQKARDSLLWSKWLRRAVYLVDLPIFLCYRLFHETLQKRVLIMDRYFYDTLVDVANQRGWASVRFLRRLTPTPDVPVFLDITPEESFARKGEYTVEYLRARHATYSRVVPLVPSAVRLKNTNLAATKKALTAAVFRRLAS